MRLVAVVPPLRALLAKRARRSLAEAQLPLFVCYGNLNRSAFAAAVRRTQRPGHEVLEAGYYPRTGRPSPDAAIKAARGFDVDLGHHRSNGLSAADVARSDAIFVFDARNAAHMLLHHRTAWRRTHFLGAMTAKGPLTVADPYGQDAPSYETVFAQISRLLS